MSPDEKISQTEIFDLAVRIWRPDSARRTASQSDKVTLLILAMAPRGLWPALIPNVGVGMREHAHTLHRQARRRRSSIAQNAECIAQCAKYKRLVNP